MLGRNEDVGLELRTGEASLLAEMLHALGQPLTVLGGCRLLARLPDAAGAEWMEEMAEQVDRVTEIYLAMRLLLEGGLGRVGVGKGIGEWRRRAAAHGVQVAAGEVAGWVVDERVLGGLLGAGLRSCEPGSELRVGVEGGRMVVTGGTALGEGVPWELRVAVAASEPGTVAGPGEVAVAERGTGAEGANGRVGGWPGAAVSEGSGVVYRLKPFHAWVPVQPA